MFYDPAQLEEHLRQWEEQLESAALPPWEALPDLPLYMDQVLLLLEQYLPRERFTASIVNNYVRMKVMPAPVKKKYTRVHLAYLIMICVLKQSLSIACIQRMLPVDLPPEQVRLRYNDFVPRHHELSCYLAEQLRAAAPPLFRFSQEEPVEVLAVGTALMANLTQSFTEQLLLWGASDAGSEQ